MNLFKHGWLIFTSFLLNNEICYRYRYAPFYCLVKWHLMPLIILETDIYSNTVGMIFFFPKALLNCSKTWHAYGPKTTAKLLHSLIIIIYLTFCTLSFEFKESSMSATGCLIQDVVSPRCGDKKNGATLHAIFSAELFYHDVISLECGENTSM